MTQQLLRSTVTLWARFRFSVVGALLSSPPARRTQGGPVRLGRQDLDASGEPARGPFLHGHHRALVLHRPTGEGRPGPCLAPRRAQRLRPGVLGSGSGRGTLPAVPRPPALDLPTALRQPGGAREESSAAGSARVVFHGAALYACATAWCVSYDQRRRVGPAKSGRPAQGTARDPQLRNRIRRLAVASRLSPRLAQGLDAARPVAASAGAGHPR